MTRRQWLKENRVEIDAAINRSLNHVPSSASCFCPKSGTDHYHDDNCPINDEDRWQWVQNDEGLYNWARQDGVQV